MYTHAHSLVPRPFFACVAKNGLGMRLTRTTHTHIEFSQEDVQLWHRRYGLLRMYYGVDGYGNHQQENPLDIDQARFRPDAYMEQVFKECSLNELYKQEGRMKKGGGE